MELSIENKAILAHVVVDPDAWVEHALETVGESAVIQKIEKYRDDYLAKKDLPDYQTRAEKEFVPEPTEEEAVLAQQAKITVAIQNLLDTTAQQRDYDDIFTLISYVDDPDYIFDAEGLAAKLWRSAVWTIARQIKADVIAGTRPMPTVEEVLGEMPAFTWPE